MMTTGRPGLFSVPIYLYAILTVLCCNTGVRARDPQEGPGTVIENHISSISDELAELSNSSAMKSTIRKAVPALRSMMNKHSEIHSLIRTNSKGRVVNEEITDGPKGKKFRDVSRQEWYGITARYKSYYNYYKKRNGDFFLFWCEPIKISSGDGGYRFGGALVAKIDLKKCIENALSDNSPPLMITAEDGFRYSKDWKDFYKGKASSLKIKGLEDAGIFVYRPTETAAAASEKNTDIKKDINSGKNVKEKKAKGPSMLNSIMLIVFILVVIITAILFVKFLVNRKNRKLMSAIDGYDPEKEGGGPEIDAVPDESPENDEMTFDNEDPFVTDKTVYIKNPMHLMHKKESSEEEKVGSKENDLESKIRAELNKEYAEKFEKALAERETVIRNSVYEDVRKLFIQNIKGYTDMLDREIKSIASLASKKDIPQDLKEILTKVYDHLKNLRDNLKIKDRSTKK